MFRTLPPCSHPTGPEFDPEMNDPFTEVNWPHMKLVYVFFLTLLESQYFHPSIAQHHLDKKFSQQILNLFDSEDLNERGLLKQILQRIYARCTRSRENILKQIIYVFYGYNISFLLDIF